MKNVQKGMTSQPRPRLYAAFHCARAALLAFVVVFIPLWMLGELLW